MITQLARLFALIYPAPKPATGALELQVAKAMHAAAHASSLEGYPTPPGAWDAYPDIVWGSASEATRFKFLIAARRALS